MTKQQGIKLYDVESGEYGEAIRGSSFRSLQIYQCGTCHAKTNRWIWGGFPGWGLRQTCPASPEFPKEHRDLESTIAKLKGLTRKIEFYEKRGERDGLTRFQAETLLPQINAESKILEDYINELRENLSQIFDLVGVDLFNAKIINSYLSPSYKSLKDFFDYGEA